MRLTDEQLQDFDDNGFLLFPSLFSSDEMAVLRRSLPQLMAREGPETVREEDENDSLRMLFGAHTFDEAFRRLSLNPRLLNPVAQLLRSPVCIFHTRLTPKSGFVGGGWGWHQDFDRWHHADGMQTPRVIMAGLFFDDVTYCNAPLMVIPGSYRRGCLPVEEDRTIDPATIRELVDDGGIEPLIGPAGSVAFVHCNTVHGSTANLSPWPRCIYYINYNSVENTDIRSPRDPLRCGIDFTPLAALGDDCLRELAPPGDD